MADFFLDLAANPRARRLVSTLGLPLPMPERLERGAGPWEERPLQGRTVAVDVPPGAALAATLATTLAEAGADPWVIGEPAERAPFEEAGEAWGRPPHAASEGPERPWALILDATGFRHPDDLRRLYDFFHPRIRGIGKSGRLIVLGRPDDATGRKDSAEAAAAAKALTGFVRSAGREVGRRGATANLIQVEPGAEGRVAPLLRFLLSPRAAYVSGQALRVSARCRATASARMVRPLDGRTVIVTGAARGIGAAIATVAAREGGRVIVVDRPEDGELGAEIARQVGGTFLGCDVTAADAPARIADFVRERSGTADVVIHNAGVTRDKTLANMAPELWDLTVGVNLTAPLKITEALEPLLGEDARLVFLSSIAGIAGNIGQTNYSASKAGVIGAVHALAGRLAGKGVAVNAIAPGFIETRLTDAIPVTTREVARRMCNLGQGGLPIDVAEVAVFLGSPGADGLSGSIVRVCGGNYVGE